MPIGSFQAVKHMLANVKVKLEYARPLVYRAAWSVAQGSPHRARARLDGEGRGLRGGGARRASALQAHGAIGYTWEQDLHLWMRRAWSLDQRWGRSAFHLARMRSSVLADGCPLGPGTTFLGGA